MKKSKEIIIAILILILIGTIIYTNSINKENKEFRLAILGEKEALKKDLELILSELTVNQKKSVAITKDFNEASKKLDLIKNQLRKSKKKVQQLKNELNSSSKSSFRKLQALRNTLDDVKINNMVLYRAMDSIKSVNDSLIVKIALAKSELNAERIQTKALAVKLSEATKIQITKVEVFAVKQKKSGKVKQTNKYKNVNGIQVNYNVLNNKMLEDVESDVYYVLKNEKGVVELSKGVFLCKGLSKQFTDGSRLILSGETMEVSDLILLEGKELKKGLYTLEFYSVDGLLAKETFELKNSFLGVF